MVVFSHCLLEIPSVSTLHLPQPCGNKVTWRKRKSLLLSSLSVAEYFVRTATHKPISPLQKTCLKQLAAQEIGTNASWISSSIKPVISTWPPEVGHTSLHRTLFCMAKVSIEIYIVCNGSSCCHQH